MTEFQFVRSLNGGAEDLMCIRHLVGMWVVGLYSKRLMLANITKCLPGIPHCNPKELHDD